MALYMVTKTTNTRMCLVWFPWIAQKDHWYYRGSFLNIVTDQHCIVKWGEGYVFTRVCHSVHRGWSAFCGGRGEGGGLHLRRWRQTPSDLKAAHSLTLQERDTVKRRSVRILLKCILVHMCFSTFLSSLFSLVSCLFVAARGWLLKFRFFVFSNIFS